MPEISTIQNVITPAAILIIAGIGVFYLFKPVSNFIATNIPNLLISMGILGTFLGIFLGLMKFDPDDIKNSVPNLIGGMQFAFGSSVAGMFFALLIKAKFIFINKKMREERSRETTEENAYDIESVLNAILEIRSSVSGGKDSLLAQFQSLREDLNEDVKKISKAISGDDDSSVVTQVKLFRGESRDELKKMNQAVDKFYDEIAGKSTDVLLEALKIIIADFNKNLNEQFGENFKELNQAVGKILEWQNQYREQLAIMIEAQGQTSENMRIATNAFNELMEKAKSLTTIGTDFRVIVNDLSSLLQALEQQRNDISNHIQLFADISEKASTGLPKVEEKINQLSQKLIDAIGIHSSRINDHLEATISKSGDLNRQMLEAMARNNEELNQHIEQAVERTNQQVVKLDQAMSEELTKALEAFGQQLASLSQTFVRDYTPLTERLKEVVQLSKGL